MQKVRIWLEQHIYLVCVLSVIAYGLAAALFHNDYQMSDIRIYNLPWSSYFDRRSVFHMYDWLLTRASGSIPAINYPPLFPAWLCLVRPVIRYAESAGNQNLMFLAVKSFGLGCHILILLYFCLKKQKKSALFWALCPAWLVLTGFWGQTDEAFAFLIWLMLEGFQKHDLYESGIVAAISCILKTQGGLLVIAWLVYLELVKTSAVQKAKAFVASVCTGILFWLPFIVLYRNFLFPLKFYLNAGSGNNGVSGAANALFWIVLGVGDEVSSKEYLVSSFICLVLCVIIFIKAYKKTDSACICMLLYLAFLYSFMPGQHERYLVYPMTAAWFLVISGNAGRDMKTTAVWYLICSVLVCVSRLVAEAGYDIHGSSGAAYWAMIFTYLAGSFVTTWQTVSLIQRYCGKKQADAVQ